ncbi:flagellar export chaperone FlgN [Fodinibius sediminis]|uniref:FlgN protein n=1 Tax=Fodinibius sediminis TaxID=1214077 RepID=A0A521CH17_9BACT|nr:flagellar export chaperone FlgN [Fodinibius sediminis]SMO58743.1 FlgN protein [Fodinibius sediminis]
MMPPQDTTFNSMPLKKILKKLIEGYKTAFRLLECQRQAVIDDTMDELEDLVEGQLRNHEQLSTAEEQFRKELERLFARHCPNEDQLSLSILIDRTGEAAEELEGLRDELRDRVRKTQKAGEQLATLLHFAQQHTLETFQEIFQLGRPGSQSYDAAGRQQDRSINSIAVNKKA